jgi:hypothetical protein
METGGPVAAAAGKRQAAWVVGGSAAAEARRLVAGGLVWHVHERSARFCVKCGAHGRAHMWIGFANLRWPKVDRRRLKLPMMAHRRPT